MFELIIIILAVYFVYKFFRMGKSHSDYSIRQVGDEWWVYLWFGYDPIARFEDYEEANDYVYDEVERRNS